MSTTKQKSAAKANLKKARKAQSARSAGKKVAKSSTGMSTADKDRLKTGKFAFEDERKEPINDAKHVRNAISRFNQVEGVSDGERDKAWKRILKAADKYDVEVAEKSWRELGSGKESKKRSKKKKTK
jgi:hypothetical protein